MAGLGVNGREVPTGVDPVESKRDSTVGSINVVGPYHSNSALGLALRSVVGLFLSLNTGGGVSLAIPLPSSSASVPIFLSSTVVAELNQGRDVLDVPQQCLSGAGLLQGGVTDPRQHHVVHCLLLVRHLLAT